MFRDSLCGVRVVDFSHVLAGPVATMMLADLGADVIKVEPPQGEMGRRLGPPWINGESAIYLSVNRNKRGIAMDLKSPAGRQAALRLVRGADIVVENFRPGVMRQLGLDYETVSADNRALVYCSISAYGQAGPFRSRPGVDGIMQAASGLMSTLGVDGDDPAKVATPVADMAGGYVATISILAAYLAARQSRQGEWLDISLYNAAIMLQQTGYASYFAAGKEPRKTGSAAPYAAPNEAYPTRDGWIMIAAYQPERWRKLCMLLDAPGLEQDPRFASNEGRVANRHALREELAPRFMARDTAQWQRLLTEADILCAPVAGYAQVAGSAEYAASGLDTVVRHPVAGAVRLPGFVPGPAHAPDGPSRDRAAPAIGEHAAEILREIGYGPADIEAFNGTLKSMTETR
ncbi:CaiB/BaiF CoA transferase family protein [Bordetella bronchialis]|uniref:CaiB/BaiF CoA transferase family protein n=1 Tax=Bordetella bronchialis TaxID=463025 RepID=UPI000AE826DE|nr:CoA transferase [Bordetella bronchialis]